MRVSFIVPAYNEAATVGEVIERVLALDLDKQVIIVDDGSTDDTPRVLEAWNGRDGVLMLRQENAGKGAAIRAAIPHLDGDITVIQDADMEYDPAEVPELIDPISRGMADVVFGSRLSGGRPQRAYLFWHLVGNRFLSLLTNILYNTTLSDMETCYKLFDRRILDGIELHSDRFEFEPEITAKVLRQKIRIYEVPISYAGREPEEGKKITWRDGFSALWTLVKYRFVD